MNFGVFVIFALLFAGYSVNSSPFGKHGKEENQALWELRKNEKFLLGTKSNLKYIAADTSRAKVALDKLLNMTSAAIALNRIEHKFSKINDIAEQLQSIASKIYETSQDDNVKAAAKKVLDAREQIQEMSFFLNSKASEFAKSTEHMINMVQFNSFDQFIFIAFLNSNYEFNMVLDSNVNVLPSEMHNLVETTFIQLIEHLWNAELAIETIKSQNPTEAAHLKNILHKVESQYYALFKETKQKINLRFPQEEVEYDNVPEGADPNENVKDTIRRLSEMLDTPKFLEPLKKMVNQTVSEKQEELKEFEEIIEEISNAFYDIKDWTQTVVKKMNLDAQNQTEAHNETEQDDGSHKKVDILKEMGNWFKKVFGGLTKSNDENITVDDELYAEVFARVFKEKMKKLMMMMNSIGQVFNGIERECNDEEKAVLKEHFDELSAMEPIKSFVLEASKYFAKYLAFDEQDVNNMNM